MAKIKLTKSAIDAAQPQAQSVELRDTLVPGFMCKVTPAGRKVFMLQYRTNAGERRKPAIGLYGELTVEQARSLAQTWLAEVRRGGDPGGDKAEARKAPTVKELCGRFMSDYSKVRNKPSTQKGYQGNIDRNIIPILGRMKVQDVKRPDVATMMKKLEPTPMEANHTLAVMRKMFNMAEIWGLRTDGTNPCRHIPQYPQGKTTRLITDEEMGKLFRHLDKVEAEGSEPPIVTLAIRLQFEFAARRSEILLLEWTWVDLENRRVAWPDSKTGGMSKPMSEEAHHLLSTVPRHEGSLYVLPSLRDPLKHMTNGEHYNGWSRILKAAGVQHVGTHGIRHRSATDIANSGIPVKVGMVLTAHKTVAMFMVNDFPSNTRALLARSAYAPELKAFAAWLGGERYTPFVIQRHLLRLEQVLPRLLGPVSSTEDLGMAFGVVGRGVPSRPPVFHATERAYSRFLHARGRLLKSADEGRHAGLCADYQRQLLEVRGLSLSSRQHHAMTVVDFLARGLGADQDLSGLTLTDIERYVALRSREVSRHSLQHVVAYLRSFLRFCHDQGQTSRPLDAIETPRTYRGELPPQALEWSTVQALIRSVDLGSKAGRRDHCILHLMAHYGLRPSEVVALRLDSIRWDTSVLHVVQRKTRSDLFLPLAPQTLRILRGYLVHERRAQGTDHPELFLRARCPSGPIERWAIGDIFKKRVRLAKLELPGHNVYRLRHTFAMRLLTRGVGVKAIGDLLGHRSLESTCTYLRLDTDMLRGVALDVPELGRRQGAHHA